jgi:hypothetical protein
MREFLTQVMDDLFWPALGAMMFGGAISAACWVMGWEA